jgi:hypothetical protein
MGTHLGYLFERLDLDTFEADHDIDSGAEKRDVDEWCLARLCLGDEGGDEQMKLFWGRSECPACANEGALLHGGFRLRGGVELEIEEGGEDASEHPPCVGRSKVWGGGERGGVETTGPAEEDKEICGGVGAGSGQWTWDKGETKGRPGEVGYFVCQPAEDVVEDAEFWSVTDGLVSVHEKHSDVLYGIA